MIRNRRHLIPTKEKFTEKFSYDNIIPTTAKLLESVAPWQTANWPKLSIHRNLLHPTEPKQLDQDVLRKKQTGILKSVEIC